MQPHLFVNENLTIKKLVDSNDSKKHSDIAQAQKNLETARTELKNAQDNKSGSDVIKQKLDLVRQRIDDLRQKEKETKSKINNTINNFMELCHFTLVKYHKELFYLSLMDMLNKPEYKNNEQASKAKEIIAQMNIDVEKIKKQIPRLNIDGYEFKDNDGNKIYEFELLKKLVYQHTENKIFPLYKNKMN